MKRFFGLLFLGLVLVSCGDDITYTTVVENAEELDRPIFSGYFSLDGPSAANCIYLDEKIPNVVDIESDCQSLVTTNPENGTIGQFPNISASNLLVINGEINHTRNLNYTSGNDIEEDVNGSNVTGQRRTDIKLYFNKKGLLILELKVFDSANNNNLNHVIVERKFKQVN